jgi:DNA-binding SARP family transcriptional activator/DNA-binding beta-propeller fold protein YncE
VLFRILGPLSVLDGDREVVLGGVKQRSLLALLVVSRNEAVSLDRLIDLLWGERPPDTAAKTIQVYISRLRRALGDGRIETRGHGYSVIVADGELDLDRFQSLVGRAQEEPPAAAAPMLREALSLYRGEPLQDLAYERWAAGEVERLSELRLGALEQLIDAQLEVGRHTYAVAELEAHVREHPLRERLRGQLMLALYRSGRQADALEVYRQGRALLDETLGLEPGPELRQLEQRILQHDESLAPPAPPLSDRVRSRRGVQLVIAGAALLLGAAAAAATVLSTRSRDADAVVARPNSVAAIDPRTERLVAVVPVGDTPTEIAADRDAVWVLNSGEGAGTISRIDVATKQATLTFSVSGTPRTIAVAGGSLWVGTAEGKVIAVDPASGVTDTTLTLRNAGKHSPFTFDPGRGWLSVGGGAVWATSLRTVTRIQPGTLERREATSSAWGRSTFGLGSLWVTGDFIIARLDPSTLRRVAQVKVALRDLPFAAGAGAVWLPDDSGHAIVRIDPRRNAVVRTIEIEGRPLGVAVGEGAVWAAVDDGTVIRIDPDTNARRAISVGGRPRSVAVGGGLVWVTVD